MYVNIFSKLDPPIRRRLDKTKKDMRKLLIAGLATCLFAFAAHATPLTVKFGLNDDQAATYDGSAVSLVQDDATNGVPAPILTISGLDVDGIGGNDDSAVVVFSIVNSTETANLLTAGYRYDPGDLLTFSITSATLTLGNGLTTHQIDTVGFTSVGNKNESTVATVTSTDASFITQTGATGTIDLTNNLAGVSNVSLLNTSTENGRARNIVATFDIQTLNVTPIAPVAYDETYDVEMDIAFSAITPGLLSNDTDDNGDTLTANKLTDPSNGTITSFSTDGAFTYQPAPGFTGVDSFTYEATDGGLTSNAATVTLNVVGTPITLPILFQDNMVLQRNQPIPVWGWGPVGQTISVSLSSGQSSTAVIDAAGRWEVSLTAMAATNGPLTLIASVPGSSQTLTNLAVGDVWFCSGQSNAGWSLSATDGGNAEMASANYPNFRLIRVPRYKLDAPSESPIILEDTLDWDSETDELKSKAGKWFVCSPETAGQFGAVFYYAGKELILNLDIPIGIIQSAYAGTPMEAWANSALPEAHPIGSDPADPQQLFNGMVYPYLKQPITGFGWYQGERNHEDGYSVTEKLSTMISDWRSGWALGDLPFYYIQIPPVFSWDTDAEADPMLPQFWEAQTAVMDVSAETYMIVASDTADGDLHPKNKAPVGERMGTRILKNTYGFSSLIDSGPVFRSAAIEGNQLRLSFDHVGGGLAINTGIGYNANGDSRIDIDEDLNRNHILDNGEDNDDDGVLDTGEDLNNNGILDEGEDIDGDGVLDYSEFDINLDHLTWFEVCGSDGVFVDATAVIDGDTVLLSAPTVPTPTGFRYAWSRFAQGNLMNAEGLPARLSRFITPIATSDHYTVLFETERYVPPGGLLTNDLIGSSLLELERPVLNTEPSNGVLVLRSDGAFIYTPKTGFSGTDSFTYMASDGAENSPATTVTLEVLAQGQGTGKITREIWTGITGAMTTDLTSSPDYPDSPDEVGTLSRLDAPRNWDNDYGQRIHGTLNPPATREYTFWISSAARSQLYLSTDADSANLTMICENTTSLSGDPENWTNSANQKSSSIALVGGQAYYIQILHKNGGSSDHCSVAWDLTAPDTPEIIEGTYLSEALPDVPTTTDYTSWSNWYGVTGDAHRLNYAFNLDPTQSGLSIMIPNTGTTGLPYWEMDDTQGLAVQYLRRKNSAGTTYTVQFTGNLTQPWEDATTTEIVSPINDTWERVTVEDSVDVSSADSRFGQVEVVVE